MNSYEQAPLADTFMGRVKEAFEHEYGVGSEQARAVLYEARKRKVPSNLMHLKCVRCLEHTELLKQ